MTERYLTPKEAASITRLSVRGLEWRRQKRIGPPVVRIGRLVRYPESKLLAWLERNCDPQASQRETHGEDVSGSFEIHAGSMESPELREAIELAGSGAVCLWVELLASCSSLGTDGEVPAASLPKGKATELDALHRAGLTSAQPDGSVRMLARHLWRIPNGLR